MEKSLKIFHYLSYVSLPFLLIAVFYTYKPLVYGLETMWEDYNIALTFMGIGLSFASLVDPTKKNKFSKKIYGHPRVSKIFLIYVTCLFLIIFSFGLYSLFFSNNEKLNELAVGVIVLGIGVLSLLRLAIEMVKNHAADINTDTKSQE